MASAGACRSPQSSGAKKFLLFESIVFPSHNKASCGNGHDNLTLIRHDVENNEIAIAERVGVSTTGA